MSGLKIGYLLKFGVQNEFNILLNQSENRLKNRKKFIESTNS